MLTSSGISMRAPLLASLLHLTCCETNNFHNSEQKEWPPQRLSGRDVCSVLGKWMGVKDREEEKCM